MSKTGINLKRRQLLSAMASISVVSMLPLASTSLSAKTIFSPINPALKKDLVIYIGAEPQDGFDPCTGWGFYGYMLFQSALLTFDDELNIKTDLAKSYDVSEEGLTYSFKLQNNIRFSDGSLLQASDVVFTFMTAKQSGSMVDLTMLETVTIENENTADETIVFRLNRPWSTFIYLLAQLGIVPKAHYHSQTYRTNPIGTGPFKLVQWIQGQQLIIAPNPYYYGQHSPFEKITILFLQEESAIAYAKAGLLDVVMVNPEYVNQQIDTMRPVRLPTVDNRGFNLPVIAPREVDGKVVGHNVLSDRAVRKALNIGIDRKKIIRYALNGVGTPAFSRVDHLPWFNPLTQFEDNRLEEAKLILESAGWVMNTKTGIREKAGIKAIIDINARTDDLQRYHLAVALAQNARELGIEINAHAIPWSLCKELAKQQPCCWGSGDYNPQDLYYGYHSNGMYNYSSYQNKTVDNYMDEALRSNDHKQAIYYWQQSQWDGETGPDSEEGDHPFIWLVNIDHVYFVREGLNLGQQRIHPHGHGWPVVGNLHQWHWDS